MLCVGFKEGLQCKRLTNICRFSSSAMYASEVRALFTANGGPLRNAVSFELSHFQKLEIFVRDHLAKQIDCPSLRLSLKDMNDLLKELGQEDSNKGARAVCFCFVSFAHLLLESSGSMCLLDQCTFRKKYRKQVEKFTEPHIVILHRLCNIMIVARHLFVEKNCKEMIMEVVARLGGNFKFKTGGGTNTHGQKREFPVLTFYIGEYIEACDILPLLGPLSSHIVGKKRRGSFEADSDEIFSLPRHDLVSLCPAVSGDSLDNFVEAIDPIEFNMLLQDLGDNLPVALVLSPPSAGAPAAAAAVEPVGCVCSPDPPLSAVSTDQASFFGVSSASVDFTDNESDCSFEDGPLCCEWFGQSDIPSFDGIAISEAEEEKLFTF